MSVTTKRDYYEILGIGRQASQDEIRSSFRRLAKQYARGMDALIADLGSRDPGRGNGQRTRCSVWPNSSPGTATS